MTQSHSLLNGFFNWWPVVEEGKIKLQSSEGQGIGSFGKSKNKVVYKGLDDENIESDVSSSYVFLPPNVTFAEITSILGKAIDRNDFEDLDNVIQNIEGYEGRPVILDNENLKNFCLNQLNLDLNRRSNHQHIHSNVLLQYSFDQIEHNYSYPVKELVLLAIAVNDKLTARYKDMLFTERNLSILSLLVSDQKYIETFIEKFPEIYQNLKNQTIQLNNNKICFFSVTALRKEQNLLDTVLVEYVLKDLKQVLQTSSPNPLYGILETASLAENKGFMKILLDSLERCIDDQAQKDLLKHCIVTFLETAISQ